MRQLSKYKTEPSNLTRRPIWIYYSSYPIYVTPLPVFPVQFLSYSTNRIGTVQEKMAGGGNIYATLNVQQMFSLFQLKCRGVDLAVRSNSAISSMNFGRPVFIYSAIRIRPSKPYPTVLVDCSILRQSNQIFW